MRDDNDEPMPRVATWLCRPATLIVLILAALTLRFAIAWPARGDSLLRDPDGYRQIAEFTRAFRIYSRPFRPEGGIVYESAYRPPLYPLVLMLLISNGVVNTSAVAVLHVLAGVATVALTYRVARLSRLGMFSVVAAALVAADPLLLNQSTLVMTETLAALFSMIVLWRLVALDRRPTYFSAATAGVAIGLAALCRPTYLPLLALVPAAMIVLRRSSSSSQDSATTQRPELMSSDETSTEPAESLADRHDAPSPGKKNARIDSPLVRRAKLAGVVAASILLTLAPWAVRNRLTFGIWKVTTTHGGYTLLLGNNPEFYEHLRTAPTGSVWAPRNDEQLMEDARAAEGLPLRAELRSAPSGRYYELEDDALAYRQAKRFIQAEPAMFVRACLFRVGQFWSPWPHTGGTLARQAVGVWYVGVFCAAVIGLVACRRELLDSPWLWSGLIVACFVAAHVAYWSNLRMRAPIMPLIALAAAAGIEKIFRILLKSRAT